MALTTRMSTTGTLRVACNNHPLQCDDHTSHSSMNQQPVSCHYNSTQQATESSTQIPRLSLTRSGAVRPQATSAAERERDRERERYYVLCMYVYIYIYIHIIMYIRICVYIYIYIYIYRPTPSERPRTKPLPCARVGFWSMCYACSGPIGNEGDVTPIDISNYLRRPLEKGQAHPMTSRSDMAAVTVNMPGARLLDRLDVRPG